jgi:Holliday junction DNA helicase RuvA
MFGKLQGSVEYVGQNFAILMTGGVGFKVMLAANALSRLKTGDTATFWIETIVREDSITLIGFADLADQELFVKLTGVSGVGPKVALAIQGMFRTGILAAAIASGDVKTLTEAPGVGKKVAERIIVELKGRVGAAAPSDGGMGGDAQGDALSALESLGYKRADCVEMVQRLAEDGDSVQSLLTKALKEISGLRGAGPNQSGNG